MKPLPLSKVYQLIEPGPVVLLTTARRGRPNVMTMSWHMMVEFVPPLIACFCLLVAWQLLSMYWGLDSLPGAWESLQEIPRILSEPRARYDILSSVRRMLTGFVLALCFAIPVGLLMGRSRKVAAFFNPLFMMIYPVPKAALMPIIMLWLGIGDASKTLVIFLGVSLPVIYHTYQGAKAVGEKLLWSGAAMGMTPRQRLFRIVLPAAMPEIMVGCRTGLVLALITMVTSEMIVRQAGIGNLLFNSLDLAQYSATYATIVIVGALGFVLDIAFEKLRGVVVGWADPVHAIAVGSA